MRRRGSPSVPPCPRLQLMHYTRLFEKSLTNNVSPANYPLNPFMQHGIHAPRPGPMQETWVWPCSAEALSPRTALRTFRPRRLLCNALRHFSSQLAFHLGRAPAPGNGAKGIGETESHGSRARSQHLTTMRLTPVHHAASRPSNRPRIGSGCSAYMTLDSTYLRCPPVSCNFRAPSATQLALHHRTASINYYCSALHELPG